MLPLLAFSCEDGGTSSFSLCEKAFKHRDFDTAIKVCEDREHQAGAYLGKAGFDLISFLKANESGEKIKAKEDPTEDYLLGTDNYNLALILKALNLDETQHKSDGSRVVAIELSRENLQKAIELLQPASASELSSDEIFLEFLATAFYTALTYLQTWDTGLTDADGVPHPYLHDGSGKQFQIQSDGSPVFVNANSNGVIYKSDSNDVAEIKLTDPAGKEYLVDSNGIVSRKITDTSGKEVQVTNTGDPVINENNNLFTITYTDNTVSKTFNSLEAAKNSVKVTLNYADGGFKTYDGMSTALASIKAALTYEDTQQVVLFDSIEKAKNSVLVGVAYASGGAKSFQSRESALDAIQVGLQCSPIGGTDRAVKKQDGHLWDAEVNGILCNQLSDHLDVNIFKSDILAGKIIDIDFNTTAEATCSLFKPVIEGITGVTQVLAKLTAKTGKNVEHVNDTLDQVLDDINVHLLKLGCT